MLNVQGKFNWNEIHNKIYVSVNFFYCLFPPQILPDPTPSPLPLETIACIVACIPNFMLEEPSQACHEHYKSCKAVQRNKFMPQAGGVVQIPLLCVFLLQFFRGCDLRLRGGGVSPQAWGKWLPLCPPMAGKRIFQVKRRQPYKNLYCNGQ